MDTFIDSIFINPNPIFSYKNDFSYISLERCYFDTGFSSTSVHVSKGLTENINAIKNNCKEIHCSLKPYRHRSNQPFLVIYALINQINYNSAIR